MNLLEALIKVRDDGIVIISEDGNRIKRENDHIGGGFMWSDRNGNNCDYLFSDNHMDNSYDSKWEIYEEPEEKYYIDLIIKNDEQITVSFLLNELFPAKNNKETHEWRKALQTFFELKSHPLSKKRGAYPQWVIFITEDAKHLDVGAAGVFPLSLMTISPLFDTKNDAVDVANEVGLERIVRMFKTFQGIYE